MNVARAHAASSENPGRRVRVMVVDDAVVVRGLYARWVEAEPDLELAASLRTGREAVSQIERIDPDVVVLDIEMPEMDGIAALPLLLQKKPNLVVLMASTVTRRNAEISLRALALGAADYIPKPASAREVTISLDFRRELIEKVRQLGQRARRLSAAAAPAAPAQSGFVRAAAAPALRPGLAPPRAAAAPREITLRPMPVTPPRVLVVGASTGGPQALNTVITQIGGVLDRAPVLITQHMPATFTTILAEHLARASRRPVREAKDGEAIDAGTVYIAPGGRHMSVERRNGVAVIVLSDGDPINFCKPSVDPLFATAGAVWGSKALGLMLTGMGADGLGGARELIAAGGTMLAQDEASSVIWGMPGQIAQAGLASALLPLDDIGARLTRLFAGERA